MPGSAAKLTARLDALGVHHREPVGRVVELLLHGAVALGELLAALGVELLQRVEPVEQRTRDRALGHLVAPAPLVDAELGEHVGRADDLRMSV